HQLAVLNSRRASRFASTAIQTFVNVLDEVCVHTLIALLHLNHLKNAASRRVRLQMPKPVSWTMIQAESAMHASRTILVNRMQSRNRALFCQSLKFLQRNGRLQTCHLDRMPSSRAAQYRPNLPFARMCTTQFSIREGRIKWQR